MGIDPSGVLVLVGLAGYVVWVGARWPAIQARQAAIDRQVQAAEARLAAGAVVLGYALEASQAWERRQRHAVRQRQYARWARQRAMRQKGGRHG
jgi:hypothetical protein